MKSSSVWFGKILMMAALVLPTQLQAQAVAKVLAVTGAAKVRRASLPPRPLRARSELLAGDRVTVSTQGSVRVVFYRQGARYRLLAGSSYRIRIAAVARLTGQPPQPLAALPGALVETARMVLQSESPHFLGTVVRSGDDAQGPRRPWPVGGVRTPAVTLRWEGPIVGAAGERLSLRVQVADPVDKRTILDRELLREIRSFSLPEHLLKPGRWYTWSVQVVGQDRSCGGNLRLLRPEERTQLERMEQAAEALHTTAEADSDADRLLAEVYERLGFFAEAREDYELVLRQHSDDADAQAAVERLSALMNSP